MPRYHFDIRDGRGIHRDEFGDVFDTFDEAREQCQGVLADLARDELPGGDLHTITCDMRDEADRVVYRGEIAFRGMRDPDAPRPGSDGA